MATTRISKLWSIPFLTAYLYVATILTQNGFNAYFGIPSSFIEASIKENVLYLFNLTSIVWAVAFSLPWWVWLVTIVAFGLLCLLCLAGGVGRIVFYAIAVLSLVLFLRYSYNFGGFLASNQSDFYAPAGGCPVNNATGTPYIIPAFGQDTAVLIPYDTSGSGTKMTGGFLIKRMADLPCAVVFKHVGKMGK